MCPNDPVALCRDPDLGLTVFRDGRDAGVRLDVSLMDAFGLECALDDDVGFLEALGDIAKFKVDVLGDVRGLGRDGSRGRQ